MADWKIPVNYSYNPTYHAYAYGLMYQAGHDQTHSNLSGWAEAAYQTGVNGGYYSSQQQQALQQESPPQSPEQASVHPDHGQQYPGPPGLLYFPESHTQNGRLFLSHNRSQHEGPITKESESTSSDRTSDSEAHTSPDSWSSGSSREGCVPLTHPATWTMKDLDGESGSRSPDDEHVSSSLSEEPQSLVMGAEEEGIPDTKHTSTPKTKPKPRAAFSQSQMISLTHRFNLQRYLTPVEMKTMAGLTGLTYKQVKTWFQNRRMKLRRHQKDNSWVSERYTGTVYKVPTHNQMDPQTQDYYNQQMREAGPNRSPPLTQKLPYYTSPSGFPPKPSSPQPGSRPQGSNWPLPPPVNHYECITNSYSMGGGVDKDMNSDEGNPPRVHSPIQLMALVRNATL